MKKLGFTLIELLAVIVVLAIIALISIPIITNVIEKAKLGALKDSAYGLVNAAENYYTKNLDSIDSYVLFEIEDSEQTSDEKLDYTGTIDGDAKIILTKEGKVAICIVSGKMYAKKEIKDSEVTVKEAKSDVTCTLPNITTEDFKLSIGESSSDYYTKEEVDSLLESYVSKENKFEDLNFNNISDETMESYEKRNFSITGNGTLATVLTGTSKFGTINNGILTFNKSGFYYISSHLIVTNNPDLQIYNKIYINDLEISSSFIYLYRAGIPVTSTFFVEEGDTLKVALANYTGTSSVYAWFLKIYKII